MRSLTLCLGLVVATFGCAVATSSTDGKQASSSEDGGAGQRRTDLGDPGGKKPHVDAGASVVAVGDGGASSVDDAAPPPESDADIAICGVCAPGEDCCDDPSAMNYGTCFDPKSTVCF